MVKISSFFGPSTPLKKVKFCLFLTFFTPQCPVHMKALWFWWAMINRCPLTCPWTPPVPSDIFAQWGLVTRLLDGTHRSDASSPTLLRTLLLVSFGISKCLAVGLKWLVIRFDGVGGREPFNFLRGFLIVKLRSRSQVRSRSGLRSAPGQVHQVQGQRPKTWTWAIH